MRIRTRFNIALGGVFILGFAVSVLVTYRASCSPTRKMKYCAMRA